MKDFENPEERARYNEGVVFVLSVCGELGIQGRHLVHMLLFLGMVTKQDLIRAATEYAEWAAALDARGLDRLDAETP